MSKVSKAVRDEIKRMGKGLVEARPFTQLDEYSINITPAEYLLMRTTRGTQRGVAYELGISVETIRAREQGLEKVTREAWRALCSLPLDENA